MTTAPTRRLIGRTSTPCCNRNVGRKLVGLTKVGDHTEFLCPTCSKAWVVTARAARSDIARTMGAELAPDWDGGLATERTPAVKPTPRKGRR